MAEESLFDYVYVVEWDDSVHRPPYTVMHGIKLNPGVSRTDFEKFMSEEGFAMGDVLTRAGAVATQYLLTDTTGQPPLAFEDSNLSLESFGNRTSVTKYHVVGTWRRIDKEGV